MNEKFSPGLVLNLQKLNYENGKLKLKTNNTNYGSVVAARKIIPPEFTESESLSVINKIAPIGISSIMLSPTNHWAIIGRRGNVLVGGKWMGYPSAIVNEKSNVHDTLIKEAQEEACIENVYRDANVHLVGISRGRRHAVNPNFNYVIEIDSSFDKIWKGTDKREHDLISTIPLDEKPFKEYIKENMFGVTPAGKPYDKLVDVGLATMLQGGRLQFGNKWFEEFIKELSDSPFNVKFENKNPFE